MPMDNAIPRRMIVKNQYKTFYCWLYNINI